MTTPDHQIPAEVLEKFRALEAAEQERQATYGQVRPIISITANGYRLVAVGSTMFWDKEEKWRTLTDFLCYFIKHVFSIEWGAAEQKKPLEERHVIMQWCEALRLLQLRNPTPDEHGVCSGEPDGPSYAYLLLAYDLYLLGDHGKLRQRFVERLKDPEEFQSARYELFVAATMIRAGFDLELENERDLTRQHPEYIATHRQTKEVFAVEAKSRRLPGVLGYRGEPFKEDGFKLDVRQVIKRALEKEEIAHPYIVFIDANMPPRYAAERRTEWAPNVDIAVSLADSQFDEVGVRVGSQFNFLAVTNVPDHYGETGGPLPEPVFYSVRPTQSRRAVRQHHVFSDIERSLGQSHVVPSAFPSSE